MNKTSQIAGLKTTLVAAAVASVLAACASAPVRPAGAAQARARLTQLQSDPNLASRAPSAIQAADAAVRVAEQPEADSSLVDYRVYMADRKIEIARAEAETRLAEDQRPALRVKSEQARLDARTREVDVAQSQVADARAAGAEQKLAADTARGQVDTDAADLAVAGTEQQELQRQIAVLQAQVTDHGLMIDMGEVLFTDDGDALKDGSSGNLDKLVTFLDKYPERIAAIEVYTDNSGTQEYDQELSQRRADSVKSYLIAQGIGSDRLTASGKGDGPEIADDTSASAAPHDRRVEVIINDPVAALR